MISFIALGIVMLIWILCWDSEDSQDLDSSVQSSSERHA